MAEAARQKARSVETVVEPIGQDQVATNPFSFFFGEGEKKEDKPQEPLTPFPSPQPTTQRGEGPFSFFGGGDAGKSSGVGPVGSQTKPVPVTEKKESWLKRVAILLDSLTPAC